MSGPPNSILAHCAPPPSDKIFTSPSGREPAHYLSIPRTSFDYGTVGQWLTNREVSCCAGVWTPRSFLGWPQDRAGEEEEGAGKLFLESLGLRLALYPCRRLDNKWEGGRDPVSQRAPEDITVKRCQIHSVTDKLPIKKRARDRQILGDGPSLILPPAPKNATV